MGSLGLWMNIFLIRILGGLNSSKEQYMFFKIYIYMCIAASATGMVFRFLSSST